MVAVDPAQWDAMRKAGKKLEELTEFDRDIIGRGTKHVIIPMMDVYNMRRVAGVLHSLASELDMLSRRHDLSPRLLMLSVQDSISQANDSIKRMTGKAKTPKPYRERLEENSK